MGDCVRHSKRIAEMESSSASLTKKMKTSFGLEELQLPSFDFELEKQRFFLDSPDKEISPATSSNSRGCIVDVCSSFICSGDSPVSECCSSVASHQVVKDTLRFVDLEAKSFETENSTCITRKFSSETTLSSEFCGDSSEMDSSAPAKSHRRKQLSTAAAKMPTQAEIEEFFAVAEKKEQKRFADKYNYDIVKDVPLEGRYQWVRLKP